MAMGHYFKLLCQHAFGTPFQVENNLFVGSLNTVFCIAPGRQFLRSEVRSMKSGTWHALPGETGINQQRSKGIMVNRDVGFIWEKSEFQESM